MALSIRLSHGRVNGRWNGDVTLSSSVTRGGVVDGGEQRRHGVNHDSLFSTRNDVDHLIGLHGVKGY